LNQSVAITSEFVASMLLMQPGFTLYIYCATSSHLDCSMHN